VISLGLVKVAIESENLSDMERLKEGLVKLDRSDPSVNFYINH
jgi:translation elongation factor EF-G